MQAFLHGLIVALSLILPLGMQNIYIFNQGANQKHFINTLPSIFTAIICDAFLIISAVLGLSLIIFAIPWLETLILYLGLIALIYIGLFIWNTKPSGIQEGVEPLSYKMQILCAASVSLFNPHALIDAVGVIGTNSMHYYGADRYFFTAACILVSVVWFFCLALFGHYMHKIDKQGKILFKLNKVSAILIWSVALYVSYLLYLSIILEKIV